MGDRPTRHPSLETTEEVKESLEIGLRRRGDPLDGWVTYRDLENAGLIEARGIGRGAVGLRPGRVVTGGPGGTGPIPPPDFGQDDLSRPPAPRNVAARGLSTTTIGVAWSPANYSNHAYAEIFASFTPSWAAITESFNELAPVGAGNQSQFFMGRSSGTSFLHTNLGSTIPSAQLDRDVLALSSANEGFRVTLDGDQRSFVDVGDFVYLSAPEAWSGNGVEGSALQVAFSGGVTIVTVESSASFDFDHPAGAILVVVKDPDELEEALNPRAIYYWVRFVSTAGVVGPVQSEEGVPGRVMADPSTILSILTGRIRGTQLASDLVSPINFIRGPVTEVDEQGNRLFPTVRDFVNSLGSDLVSEYDEVLNQVFVGFAGQAFARITEYWHSGSVAMFYTTENPGLASGDTFVFSVTPGQVLEGLAREVQNGERVASVSSVFFDPDRELWALTFTVDNFGYSFPGPINVAIPLDGVIYTPGDDGEFNGVASAAAYVQRLAAQAGAQGAWVESLETLQAAFEDVTATGIRSIIGTIRNRELVWASDERALVYIGEKLQLEYGLDGEGEPAFIFLNEVGNVIEQVEEAVNQSWTVKLQANNNGVIYSTGFGLGLETDLSSGQALSTFAVAADQFAIMSSASAGRRALSIRDAGDKAYLVTLDGGANPNAQDGLVPGTPGVDATRVTVTVPFDAPPGIRAALRGNVFELVSRQVVGQNVQVQIQPPGEEPRPANVGETGLSLQGGFAMFPEQLIPFIVDTGTGTVGVRGRLIVDGMITATDVEVTNLLTSNQIWAQGILSFGLINTASLIGNAIATEPIAGWSVKMAQVDQTYQNRVFEFSRWDMTDVPDVTPDPNNPLDYLVQQETYPMLRDIEPIDSSFWLDADGRAFLRASLQIGGNLRILTLDPAALGDDVNYRFFLQSDNEFPLMIYPFDKVFDTDQNTLVHEPWNYNSNIRALVRQHALMWVNKDGTAGFNTRNNAIFVGDTPMEPPSGYGYVQVKTRLQEGQWTGRGRVWVSCHFQQYANRNTDRNLVFCTYGLFLVPATANYFTTTHRHRPSQRSGMPVIRGEFSGQPVYTYSPEEANYIDSHFLMLRHPTLFAAGQDPAWGHYQNFKNSPGAIFLAEFSGLEYPGGRTIQGFANNVPQGNYRALIVIAERFDRRGRPVWGTDHSSADGDDTRKLATMPVYPTIVSQQVSKTPYDGQTFNPGQPGTPGPPGEGAPPTMPPTLPPTEPGVIIP